MGHMDVLTFSMYFSYTTNGYKMETEIFLATCVHLLPSIYIYTVKGLTQFCVRKIFSFTGRHMNYTIK